MAMMVRSLGNRRVIASARMSRSARRVESRTSGDGSDTLDERSRTSRMGERTSPLLVSDIRPKADDTL